MKKEAKNWEFYYYYEDGGKKHISGTKYCKVPERTKIHKQLLNSLDMGFISVFGYQVVN